MQYNLDKLNIKYKYNKIKITVETISFRVTELEDIIKKEVKLIR